MSLFPKTPSVEPGDLPPHSVVVNRRARRIRIRVSPEEGVIVVVPRAGDRRHVDRVLREHADWIARALARTEARRAHLASAVTSPPPGRIDLPGIGVAFAVEYRASSAPGVRAMTRGSTVTLYGAVNDAAACRAALRRWLSKTAAERLPALLAAVADAERLSYGGVTVRSPRTRWGSCTLTGRISLNRSLVFLEPGLVRYVMVHELLHTVRHDHSPAFWRLMEERVPASDRLRSELKDAWSAIPPWASGRDARERSASSR